MTHVRAQPFGGVIFADAGDAIARQVFGSRRFRPFDPQAGSNVTITPNALGVVIASTGGSSTPDDASQINAARSYAPTLRVPTIRAADGSVTVTQDALGYLIAAASSATVDDASAIIAAREFRDRLQAVITEINLFLSDNTMADVTTARHGFAPKGLGDPTKFLNSNGTYSIPTGTSSSTDFLIVQVFS